LKDTSLLSSKSSPARIKREFGGKGANLYKLSRRGLPVPKWIGIPSSVFSAFKLQMGLEPKIQEILNQTPGQLSFKDASDQITQLLRQTVLPDSIIAIVSEAYDALGIDGSKTKLLSVRSSAADEDGSKHSFAGQLSSFLYVKGKDDVLKFVLECWASGYTERGLSYRHMNQIPLHSEIKVAVVVQEMILADKSGVLFTVDPVTQNPDNLTISSVFGVGEGLVSGALDSDTFVVSKRDGKVIEKTVVEKRVKRRGGAGRANCAAIAYRS
jgi:rifampicin phosphotransferase